jgi:hypothetical protein
VDDRWLCGRLRAPSGGEDCRSNQTVCPNLCYGERRGPKRDPSFL